MDRWWWNAAPSPKHSFWRTRNLKLKSATGRDLQNCCQVEELYCCMWYFWRHEWHNCGRLRCLYGLLIYEVIYNPWREKIFTFSDHPKLCKINVLDGRLSFYKWLHTARVEFDREESLAPEMEKILSSAVSRDESKNLAVMDWWADKLNSMC